MDASEPGKGYDKVSMTRLASVRVRKWLFLPVDGLRLRTVEKELVRSQVVSCLEFIPTSPANSEDRK